MKPAPKPAPKPTEAAADQESGIPWPASGAEGRSIVTNQEAWQTYIDYTGLASEHARKLGLAAGALAWLLKGDGGFTGLLPWSLLALVLFFFCDTLQYVVGAWMVRTSIRKQELGHGKSWQSADYVIDPRRDRPAFILWNAKLCALLITYALLELELCSPS